MNNDVEKIRALLNEAALNHPEIQGNDTKLAQKAKLQQPTVSRILNGETKDPRISNIFQIARACGIRILETESRPGRQKYYDLVDSLDDENLQILDRLIDLSQKGWEWVDLGIRLGMEAEARMPKEKRASMAEVHKLEP